MRAETMGVNAGEDLIMVSGTEKIIFQVSCNEKLQ